jgi:ubiquitin-protein ligase
MGSIRERRIENEWQTLLQIVAHNVGVLTIIRRNSTAGVDRFEIELHRSGGLLKVNAAPAEVDTYGAVIEFPDFFPAVPMQVFLSRPLLHPNVQPVTGFICLWDETSPGDSVIEALQRLQLIVSWKMFNDSPDHLMQPEAFDLYPSKQALPIERIQIPEHLLDVRSARSIIPSQMRRRLS